MIDLLAHFFTGMKIKYEDHPFLFIPPVLLLLVIVPVYAVFGMSSLPFLLAVTALVVSGTIFHAYRGVQQEIQAHQCQVQALTSLHQQLNFRLPLPSIYGWAAKPEMLSMIQGAIALHKPRNILELGSGVSTLVAAYSCEKNGSGKVWSLDHDTVYLQKTKRLVLQHKLEPFAEAFPAPLIDTKVDGKTHNWYSLESLPKELRFDMLIIDGPPHTTQPMARYPALNLLYDRLNPGAVIVLDDADRADEQESIRKWTDRYEDIFIDETSDVRHARVLIKKKVAVSINGRASKSVEKKEKNVLFDGN